MACTVAVEEVIDEHYQDQINNLDASEELKEKIEQFRQEELEHRDIGLQNYAENSKVYKPLSFIIKNAFLSVGIKNILNIYWENFLPWSFNNIVS